MDSFLSLFFFETSELKTLQNSRHVIIYYSTQSSSIIVL